MLKGNKRGLKLSLFVVLLLTAGLVAGCEPAEEADDLELEIMAPEDIPELAPLPACDLAPPPSPPVPIYPAENDLVLDLQPEFDWTFGLECEPMGYHLDVFTTAGGTQGNPDVFNNDTGSLATLYSGISLQAATWHQWRACAVINPGAMACHSDPVPFVTGPLCGPGEIMAPNLYLPSDGAIDNGKGYGNIEEVILTVEYPGENCIPEYFQMVVSPFEDFSVLHYSIKYGNHGVHYPGYTNPNGLLLAQTESDALQNCTKYYWRSRGIVGDSEGPYSDTHTFYTDFFGDCLAPFEFGDFPYITAPQDTNCRLGDTTQHQNVATVLEGDETKILAVNPEGTHVRILEERSQIKCWVWLGLVDLMLGPELLDPSVLFTLVSSERPPALPTATYTPTPVPTATFTPVPPQCSDGIDNDGDGLIDYVAPSATGATTGDPQCSNANDNDELN